MADLKCGTSRTAYCYREDVNIVKYLLAKNAWHLTSGNVVWKEMEQANLCPGRSFQSLRNRYLKNLKKRLKTDFKHIVNCPINLSNNEGASRPAEGFFRPSSKMKVNRKWQQRSRLDSGGNQDMGDSVQQPTQSLYVVEAPAISSPYFAARGEVPAINSQRNLTAKSASKHEKSKPLNNKKLPARKQLYCVESEIDSSFILTGACVPATILRNQLRGECSDNRIQTLDNYNSEAHKTKSIESVRGVARVSPLVLSQDSVDVVESLAVERVQQEQIAELIPQEDNEISKEVSPHKNQSQISTPTIDNLETADLQHQVVGLTNSSESQSLISCTGSELLQLRLQRTEDNQNNDCVPSNTALKRLTITNENFNIPPVLKRKRKNTLVARTNRRVLLSRRILELQKCIDGLGYNRRKQSLRLLNQLIRSIHNSKGKKKTKRKAAVASGPKEVIDFEKTLNKLRLEEATIRKEIAHVELCRAKFTAWVEKLKAQADQDFIAKKTSLELQIIQLKLRS